MNPIVQTPKAEINLSGPLYTCNVFALGDELDISPIDKLVGEKGIERIHSAQSGLIYPMHQLTGQVAGAGSGSPVAP